MTSCLPFLLAFPQSPTCELSSGNLRHFPGNGCWHLASQGYFCLSLELGLKFVLFCVLFSHHYFLVSELCVWYMVQPVSFWLCSERLPYTTEALEEVSSSLWILYSWLYRFLQSLLWLFFRYCTFGRGSGPGPISAQVVVCHKVVMLFLVSYELVWRRQLFAFLVTLCEMQRSKTFSALPWPQLPSSVWNVLLQASTSPRVASNKLTWPRWMWSWGASLDASVPLNDTLLRPQWILPNKFCFSFLKEKGLCSWFPH